MPAVRRSSLIAVLMTCAVLAIAAPAARAQMGSDLPPHRLAPAPIEVVSPTSPTALSDLGSLRQGSLPMSASLAVYRWLEAGREFGIRQVPVVRSRNSSVRSAWFGKRF